VDPAQALGLLVKLIAAAILAVLVAACGSASTSGGTVASDRLFSADNAWNRPVDTAPLASTSAATLAALQAAGGFGTGQLRVDFSITRLEATASTPAAPFTQKAGYYLPDCDALTTFPLPPGGALEGEAGYTCSGGGDCHLLVVDRAHGKLYEAWDADASLGRVTATCAVVWTLATAYPPELRGDQCTSADAAGLPVAALLFDADEVAAGTIDHAIRFILPNPRMAAGRYVRPATHAGSPGGGSALPPYGSRLRLRASYPLTSLSAPAQVVARALQRYGMILADGGTIALTAADDRFTTHRWATLGFDASSLATLQVGDFEVVDPGPPVTLTYACVRNGR